MSLWCHQIQATIACVLTFLLLVVAKNANDGSKFSNPPPYSDYAKRARYDVNHANWAAFTTIGSQKPLVGRPFPKVESMVDGPVGAGTGVPYFYLMKNGGPMTDVKANSNVSIGISEAEMENMPPCQISSTGDPQMPICARVLLFGNAYEVTDEKELAFAQKALFQRHPVMPNWPPGHDFEVVGVNLTNIWILDFFGGPVYVDVKDYFSVNATQPW